MVKFSKQFEGQLVPEWKEAFVDYWKLKKELKRIHLVENHNTKIKQNMTNSMSSIVFSCLGKFTFLGCKPREPKTIHVIITYITICSYVVYFVLM